MKTEERIDDALKAKLAENLGKTFELIELHQGLKFALYKKLHPTKNNDELMRLISDARLMRKQV